MVKCKDGEFDNYFAKSAMSLAVQLLTKVLQNGKTVTSSVADGKIFTSLFDEAGKLMKTRIKYFKKYPDIGSLKPEQITRYQTTVDYEMNEVVNETATRRYNWLNANNSYLQTDISKLRQQMGYGNLLSTETYVKSKPNGIWRSSGQWAPFDLSNVQKF